MKTLFDVASILRLHIIAIAIMAALTFGLILTDALLVTVALLGGLDWLLINLLNRVTDVEEDIANKIRGTERLVGKHHLVLGAWVTIELGSLILGHVLYPELTPFRLVVQLIGVGYSYRIVPTYPLGRGLKRLKDLYFFKNFMSAVLFVLTCLVYPLVAMDFAFAPGFGWSSALVLVLFFVPFEITYEILYDMRDLEGDRLARVPTYPVVHGLETSARIIDALLVLATTALVVGLLTDSIGLRESLMLLAPALQLGFYKPRFRRGLTSAECIGLTWLGAGLLAFWLVGTHLWSQAGLPSNVWLDLF